MSLVPLHQSDGMITQVREEAVPAITWSMVTAFVLPLAGTPPGVQLNAHSRWPLCQITNAPENRRSNLSAARCLFGMLVLSVAAYLTSLRLLAACSKAGFLRGIRQGRWRLQ